MNKKGINPLIASVLLIGVVIVAGVIIFVWGTNLQKTTIDRQETDTARLGLTRFSSSFADTECTPEDKKYCYRLLIKNTENFPISVTVLTHTDSGSDVSAGYILNEFDRKIITVNYVSSIGSSNIKSEIKASKIDI